jgi:hypothetical protein
MVKNEENDMKNETTCKMPRNSSSKRAKAWHLTYKEIMNSLQEFELNTEEIDDFYEKLSRLGIDVADETEELEMLDEDAEKNPPEEVDLTIPEGVSINDPVRMYLKEIGKIPLLTPMKRSIWPKKWRPAARRPSAAWRKPTCVWWSASPRNMWAGACSSWT